MLPTGCLCLTFNYLSRVAQTGPPVDGTVHIGWALLYQLSIKKMPRQTSTQTNLMEAIPEFKFPLPRCVSLVAKFSQHREPPWIFLTWFQCEPRPSIPYLIEMSHMPQISQDTEGHICLLSPELLLMESLLGFAF